MKTRQPIQDLMGGYTIVLSWDADDSVFMAECLEWRCSTRGYGKTVYKAIKDLRLAVSELDDFCRETGGEPPVPGTDLYDFIDEVYNQGRDSARKVAQ